MTCDCDCQMLSTIQTLIRRNQKLERAVKVQDDIIENLRDLAVLQRERMHYLDNRISILEMAMQGMDYDEEECDCECNGQ